jgi:hypothetical protein
VETIAVYWESIVRIYGFTVTPGLALLNFRVDADAWNTPGAAAVIEASEPIRFEAAAGQCLGGTGHVRSILTAIDQVTPLRSFIEKRFGKSAVEDLVVTAPVDVISFQGPHFGDRFGIVNNTFQAVDKAGVPVLGSGFSSSTVYLVFPGGTANRVQRRLAEVFTVPEGP